MKKDRPVEEGLSFYYIYVMLEYSEKTGVKDIKKLYIINCINDKNRYFPGNMD